MSTVNINSRFKFYYRTNIIKDGAVPYHPDHLLHIKVYSRNIHIVCLWVSWYHHSFRWVFPVNLPFGFFAEQGQEIGIRTLTSLSSSHKKKYCWKQTRPLSIHQRINSLWYIQERCPALLTINLWPYLQIQKESAANYKIMVPRLSLFDKSFMVPLSFIQNELCEAGIFFTNAACMNQPHHCLPLHSLFPVR